MSDTNLEELFDELFEKKPKNNNIDINEKEESLKTNASQKQDKNFEIIVRKALEINLPITIIKERDLDKNKEFTLYKMELFSRRTHTLIKSEGFLPDKKYYYLKNDDEFFILSKKNFLKMIHYNSKTKEKEIIEGFEDTQQLSNESPKLYIKNTEEKTPPSNLAENNPEFFDDIQLNLLSEKTINFIGKNNNIPKDILKNCYIRAKLLSKGNSPYAICFGKEKEVQPTTGKVHFPMEEYYSKFSIIKGQFDGAYSNSKKIELTSFFCKIIFSTFNEIPQNKQILFEMKNGDIGETRVINQAIRYQENAKTILNNTDFYHIIIIRSKYLGEALEKKITQIKEKNLNNFAILCMENNLKLFNKDLPSKPASKVSENSDTKSVKSEKTVKTESEMKQILKILSDFKNSIEERLRNIDETLKEMNGRISALEGQKNKE